MCSKSVDLDEKDGHDREEKKPQHSTRFEDLTLKKFKLEFDKKI